MKASGEKKMDTAKMRETRARTKAKMGGRKGLM